MLDISEKKASLGWLNADVETLDFAVVALRRTKFILT